MAKEKKHEETSVSLATEAEQVTQPSGTDGPAKENGPTSSANDRMAKARAARGSAKKRNMTNRPFYTAVGENSRSGGKEIVAGFSTRGQAMRWLDNLPNYVQANFDKIELWRCKEVDI